MTTDSARRRPTLLLVVGSGRSGTSTISGTLSRLGFRVPQPEVPADDTNPRGFYEPQWVVDFHRRLLKSAEVHTTDARPEALALADERGTRPETVDELATWLSTAGEGDLVVKDPRTFWFHRLWHQAAEHAGFDLAFLTMLRHPAAVVRSRDTHYLSGRDEAERRSAETKNVAAWCHALLVTEQVTRTERRAFVHYDELTSEWRTAVRRAGDQLGVGAAAEVPDGHHPVDDFIDVQLNRNTVTWQELSVHPLVSDLADEVWGVARGLVEDPSSDALAAELDRLHGRYDALYTLARDLTLDQVNVERRQHRRRLRAVRERTRAQTQRLEKKVQRFEREVERLSAENTELRARTGFATRPRTGRALRRRSQET